MSARKSPAACGSEEHILFLEHHDLPEHRRRVPR
jgi:hypothetical protein